jgi:hypothetical protein
LLKAVFALQYEDMAVPHGHSWDLLSAFCHALAHQLRTPLSVISNDLAYFKSILPAGETERSAKRLNEVTGLLKKLNQNFKGALSMQPVEAAVIFKEFEWQEDKFIAADAEKLRWAWEGLKESFLALCADSAGAVEAAHQDGKLLLKLRTAAATQSAAQNGSITLSEFFNRCYGQDNVEAVLWDAIFGAHGAQITLAAESKITLSIVLTLV